MKPQMPPIDSADKLFHDGNPLTGEKGTIVTADFLNNTQGAVRDVQAELIAVLTSAGITADAAKQSQLLAALNKLFLVRSNPFSDIAADGAATLAKALQNLGFSQVLGSPGYAVFPNGFVIQWGTATVPVAGSITVNYLLSFDTGLAQLCSPIDLSSTNNYRVGVATSTKSSITMTSTNTQSVTGVMWMAIGKIAKG